MSLVRGPATLLQIIIYSLFWLNSLKWIHFSRPGDGTSRPSVSYWSFYLLNSHHPGRVWPGHMRGAISAARSSSSFCCMIESTILKKASTVLFVASFMRASWSTHPNGPQMMSSTSVDRGGLPFRNGRMIVLFSAQWGQKNNVCSAVSSEWSQYRQVELSDLPILWR